MDGEVVLTREEAESLALHLELYILEEVRDVGEDYDNFDYLLRLVHVYEKCKGVRK